MAKKKKVAKKKPTKSRVAKTPGKPKKKPAAAVSKKPRGSSATGSRRTSVDTLLKKYEKERKTQEAQLSSSLKKIEELELKATKLQEQIAKLKEQAKSTQHEIDQHDSRRDAEVAEVLGRLGVQLSANSSAAGARPVLTLGMSSRTDEEASDEQESDDD